jgi:exonuclease SbcC
LEQSEHDALKQRVTAHDSQLKEAQTLLKEAQAQTQGLERPDLSALEATRDAAKSAREESEAELVRIKEDLKAIDKLKKDLEKRDGELKAAEDKYGVIGNLSDTANGRYAKRMTFQRFVLTAVVPQNVVRREK